MKTTRNEQMSRLFLLLAIGGVLFVATPCAAGVTPCRFDGVRCRTNEDCCSGVCTANVCGPRTTKCQAFPATGQTMSFQSGDDGAIQAGAPLSYTDNGDGTITDNNTGLVWEKKSADGSIHDMDRSEERRVGKEWKSRGSQSEQIRGQKGGRRPNAPALARAAKR